MTFSIKNRILFCDDEPIAEITSVKPDTKEFILWCLNGYERMMLAQKETLESAESLIKINKALLGIVA